MRNATDSIRLIFRALPGVLLLGLAGCAFDPSSRGGVGHFHTVVVDAGHGGSDRGARAVSGLNEKSLTLDTAHRLAETLRQRGFHVIETRRNDTFIPLGQRVATANAAPNSIFVSVHYNWNRRRRPSGIEVYYYNPRSRPLATHILRQVLKAYPTTNRGVKRNTFYVLHHNRRPAVLCELGFVSNPANNRFIQDPARRQSLAERIADGIVASRR
jgi:N-acetylmuramoyl-L-alanine amidase